MTGPESNREALYDLGWFSERSRRRYMSELEHLVMAKHDFDVDRIKWSAWKPCPDYGPSSWISKGELDSSGDVLVGGVVVSEDHETVVAWEWRSNGREPAAWRADDLHSAAIEHSATAPRNEAPQARASRSADDGATPPLSANPGRRGEI